MTDPPAVHPSTERCALILSPIGYAVFGALGAVFFLLTHSEAILLDSVYSLISIVLALLALRISNLLARPGSNRFHFGFAHFEPLINTVRVLLILGVDAFALLSAVGSLTSGGRPLETGLALAYGVLAAAACLTMGTIQNRLARKIDSPLLRVDARNWFVDGIISSGIGLAFLFGFLIRETTLSGWVPYIDPLLVTVLVLGTLPIMLKSLRESVPQVLLAAPDPLRQSEIRQEIEKAMGEFEYRGLSVRMIEVGRLFYVMIHVILPEEMSSLDPRTCDRARADIDLALGELYSNAVADVIFTTRSADALVPDETISS